MALTRNLRLLHLQTLTTVFRQFGNYDSWKCRNPSVVFNEFRECGDGAAGRAESSIRAKVKVREVPSRERDGGLPRRAVKSVSLRRRSETSSVSSRSGGLTRVAMEDDALSPRRSLLYPTSLPFAFDRGDGSPAVVVFVIVIVDDHLPLPE